jgi:TolA-binding protein
MISEKLLKTGALLILPMVFSACLQTRSEVGENEQSQVYSRKNSANQKQAEVESQLNQKGGAVQAVDERDELIRTLNGRVESLENQIAAANKEKAAASSQDSQKIALLQEALAKMEAQIKNLEAQQIQAKAQQEAAALAAKNAPPEEAPVKVVKKNGKDPVAKPGEKNTGAANAYEIAQGHFANKEWKKAILNYQKYVDEHPKGKEISDSKYKIGVCFQELGMKEEAMAFFEEVVANYGKTESGKKAKLRLSKLKK